MTVKVKLYTADSDNNTSGDVSGIKIVYKMPVTTTTDLILVFMSIWKTRSQNNLQSERTTTLNRANKAKKKIEDKEKPFKKT